MADKSKAEEAYSPSDKLGIALACLAGVMAIALFLLEKTPRTVIVLLTLMVSLSIYPILHFAKANMVRIFLTFGVVVVAVLLGWKELPKSHLVEASQQQPNVQQSNKGSNDTNVNGNNNTVTNKTTVINRNDPNAKAQLDRIEKLLQDQQDDLTPKKLLAKYPLGYVIFDVDYSQQVFPYQSQALQNWKFDWSVVKLTDRGDTVEIMLPNIVDQSGNALINDGYAMPKKVGPFPNGSFALSNVRLGGEILAVTKDGIVFLIGFSNIRPRLAH